MWIFIHEREQPRGKPSYAMHAGDRKRQFDFLPFSWMFTGQLPHPILDFANRVGYPMLQETAIVGQDESSTLLLE
ncbi:hypothetical protein D3C81_1475770 [compost metagenome]